MLESNFVLLQFVEITPYKRNVHISVQLNRGTDKQVCKHLASQLRIHRTNYAETANALLRCQEELEKRNKCLEILQNKENEQNTKQIENEVIFKKRLEDEIDKERRRTDASITAVK